MKHWASKIPTVILGLILKQTSICHNWNQSRVALLFELCIKNIKLSLHKAMPLKLSGVLSSARSSFFATVLCSGCTDCSTAVGVRHTAVRGHQLSMQTLEAAASDCEAALQRCWAFEKLHFDLGEQAKCSPAGLSLFCCLPADRVLCKCFCKSHRARRKINPLFPGQVGEKGTGCGWLLIYTEVLPQSSLHTALFEKAIPKVTKFTLCGILWYWWNRGKTSSSSWERNSCPVGLLRVFYLNYQAFIRKIQQESVNFSCIFLTAR